MAGQLFADQHLVALSRRPLNDKLQQLARRALRKASLGAPVLLGHDLAVSNARQLRGEPERAQLTALR